MGYELNKKIHYRLKLGPSTIIGGFQLSNHRRFEFIYESITTIQAQAIRKANFQELMRQWPGFEGIIGEKFFRFYSDTIYLPLLKKKKIDIHEGNMRADYNS